MGRVNKTTEGVFVNIVGTSSKKSAYHQFITRKPQESEADQTGGYCVADYVREYKNKINNFKTDFQQLSSLEVIIMQMRSRDDLKNNLVLYTVRNTYIYARCPFFRSDKDTNEVRVLVDNIEFNLNSEGHCDLQMLSGSDKFMSKVHKKVLEVMDYEIKSNISDYKKIYNNNL